MDLQTILKDSKTTIVDVREPQEYQSGHIEGAVNIPLGTIPMRIEEFKQMSKPLVVYCRSGMRSAQAQGFLKAHGVEQIYNGGSIFDVHQLLIHRKPV